jgi:hypothetical protein
MKFCDQTAKVVRGQSKTPANDDNPSGAVATSVRQYSDSNKWQISPSNVSNQGLMEDMALAFCYNYHVGNKNPHVRNETLLISMKALGMVSLAAKMGFGDYKTLAQAYYARAIKCVNVALTLHHVAIEDATLLSVLILAHFEAVAGNDYYDNGAWSKHVCGIMALLVLRGTEQFTTPGGRALFIQTTTFVVTRSLRNCTPTPAALQPLLRLYSRHVADESEPAWRITLLMIRLCNFKAKVTSGRETDPEIIVAGMRAIDADFAAVFVDAPLWAFDTIPSPRPASSYLPAYMQVFQSSLAVQHWNMMRTGRLVCQGYIITALKQNGMLGRTQESRAITHRLQQDILSTVPQHLGLPEIPPYATDLIPLAQCGAVCPTLDVVLATQGQDVKILRSSRSWLMRSSLRVAGLDNESGTMVRKAVEEMFRHCPWQVSVLLMK